MHKSFRRFIQHIQNCSNLFQPVLLESELYPSWLKKFFSCFLQHFRSRLIETQFQTSKTNVLGLILPLFIFFCPSVSLRQIEDFCCQELLNGDLDKQDCMCKFLPSNRLEQMEREKKKARKREKKREKEREGEIKSLRGNIYI